MRSGGNSQLLLDAKIRSAQGFAAFWTRGDQNYLRRDTEAAIRSLCMLCHSGLKKRSLRSAVILLSNGRNVNRTNL